MSDPKRRRNEIPGPERQSPEHQSPERRSPDNQGSEGDAASTWSPPAEPCPSRDSLAAWADGELPEAAAAKLAAHLPDCAICRADLAELGAFQAKAMEIAAQMDRDLAALRPDRSAQAAAAGDAAKRLARDGIRRDDNAAAREAATGALAGSSAGSSAGPLSGLRRVLAAFQPPQPLPAALRARGGGGAGSAASGDSATSSGSRDSSARHFSFSADEGQVIISCVIRPDDDPHRYRLGGRVHGLNPSAVELLDEAGGILARDALDAHGAFQLSDLGGGRRRLRFDGPGLVLELDRAIEIGPMEAA